MKSHTIPLALIALAIFTLAIVLLIKPINTAIGGAFTGTSAYLQVATTTTVGPSTQRITLFTANDTCKARVVTTNYGGIFLSFGDTTGFGSTTIANGVGHWQPASTTVNYDGGVYGCGRMTGYATASTSITISEF